uniref:U6 small nuclear RNA (adenine-(43)-N(6))-methyltransferase n=1 Tax=Culicoides sonorensis TaxID=179676 RepID=A0A336LZE0_CULSO
MSLNRYMHPRNIYRKPPDFNELASIYKEFCDISTTCIKGRRKVDFKDQNAVRILTQCLLHKDFNLVVNFPPNKLVPTLALRLNYILWLEDILAAFQFKENIRGVDIGCGASCIYGLLSSKMNGWEIYGTDVDSESIQFAKENVTKNKLDDLVHVIQQREDDKLFELIKNLSDDIEIHFCMCNPPFYETRDESPENRTGNRDEPRGTNTGSGKEISVEGSEISFVKKIIDESLELKYRIKIYTSMLGKKSSLANIKKYLKERGISNFISTEFCQGRTTRWGVAWSFVPGLYLNKVPQYERKNMRKPTGHCVKFVFPPNSESPLNLDLIEKGLEKLFTDLRLKIFLHEREHDNSIWEISASENTWSHQRRKRRMQGKVDDAPPVKKTKSPDSNVTKEDQTSFLVFGVCLKQESENFILELGYLEGSAGKDAANQVLQFIKNNYKKYI